MSPGLLCFFCFFLDASLRGFFFFWWLAKSKLSDWFGGNPFFLGSLSCIAGNLVAENAIIHVLDANLRNVQPQNITFQYFGRFLKSKTLPELTKMIPVNWFSFNILLKQESPPAGNHKRSTAVIVTWSAWDLSYPGLGGEGYSKFGFIMSWMLERRRYPSPGTHSVLDLGVPWQTDISKYKHYVSRTSYSGSKMHCKSTKLQSLD